MSPLTSNTAGTSLNQASPTVLVVAGEASGDRHAARLISELQHLKPELTFVGIGGDQMKAEGVELLYHASQMNVSGFLEVARHYRFLRSAFSNVVTLARDRRPIVAILVDYPGFNLRLARRLHQMQVPIVYYIAPQVWAWKEGRVDSLRRYVNDLIVAFPFEVEYFHRHGIGAHFFGHPLVDQLAETPVVSPVKRMEDRSTVAYLPGSRPQEIRFHMPTICQVIRTLGSGVRHVIPLAPTLDISQLEQYQSASNFEIATSAFNALSIADAALVKSGTSTLEAGLLGVPFAAFYKTSNVSYRIAKHLIKVNSTAMVNLLAGKLIVREFIQDQFTADALSIEVRRLLMDDEYRREIKNSLREVTTSLGGAGAARRAAEYILQRYLRDIN